jgi:hypothetical protein
MKKIFLLLLFIIFTILFISCSKVNTNELNKEKNIQSNTKLDEFYSNIKSGGVPMDGIPPIEIPVYIDKVEADNYLDDEDRVFFYRDGDIVKVFPQSILVWHEIVNDRFGEKNVSITYCPLTGSVIGYFSGDTTLGVSGKLLNSNLVMYDRKTESYYPQILGTSIYGDKKGQGLDTFMINWSTWGKVKENFDEIMVLSEDTGFFRDYDRDPYGSYDMEDSYYYNNTVFFEPMIDDGRLPKKQVVIGVIDGESRLAVKFSDVREEGIINYSVGDKWIALVYDEKLDTVRVFERNSEDQIMSLSEDKSYIKDNRASTWNLEGVSTNGKDDLKWVRSFDVMWFSWAAFFPEADVYGE